MFLKYCFDLVPISKDNVWNLHKLIRLAQVVTKFYGMIKYDHKRSLFNDKALSSYEFF